MPPKEFTEMIASPEPQTALMRFRTKGAGVPCLAITMGAITGPVLGIGFLPPSAFGVGMGAGGLGVGGGVSGT